MDDAASSLAGLADSFGGTTQVPGKGGNGSEAADDFYLVIDPVLVSFLLHGLQFQTNNCRKNASSAQFLQAKMMLRTGKNAWEEAQKCFDDICRLHEWSLKDLARESSYRLETLQKALRPNSGVTFNNKMREAVEEASARARERSKIAEDSPSYRSKIAARSFPPREQIISREIIDLLTELPSLPPTSKRLALERINELAAELKRLNTEIENRPEEP